MPHSRQAEARDLARGQDRSELRRNKKESRAKKMQDTRGHQARRWISDIPSNSQLHSKRKKGTAAGENRAQ